MLPGEEAVSSRTRITELRSVYGRLAPFFQAHEKGKTPGSIPAGQVLLGGPAHNSVPHGHKFSLGLDLLG